ncbi:MAG: nucleotidyltransferase domain-containing protein [Ruminococcus sp.]|jgi:predicted nucleotidyltransferase|nr:nucleotidyltransferase domain-containing protein [Ruminococcus sp.]
MIYTIEEIKEKIRPIAEKYNLPAVYLFGSYARGEADEKSDIDIMIDRTGADFSKPFAYFGLFDDFSDMLSKEVDMITTAALTKTDDRHFRNAVQKEMVQIYAGQYKQAG